MTITLAEFIDRAMDVPFVEGGRDYDGWDCWGLVVCCQRDVYGRILPSHSGEYGSTARRDELKALIERDKTETDLWELVDEPETGCLVLLYLYGRPCHIGVMVDHRNVLHTEAKCNTVTQRIDRTPWRGEGYDKVEGYYRFTG